MANIDGQIGLDGATEERVHLVEEDVQRTIGSSLVTMADRLDRAARMGMDGHKLIELIAHDHGVELGEGGTA